MRVLVLGGDGFCGWPTAVHLKKMGHDVIIVDNLSRRDPWLTGTHSLTPIADHGVRSEVSGIRYCKHTVGSRAFSDLMRELEPECIVHLAEQRSAPWSMLGPIQARLTVANNIVGTQAVLINMQQHAPNCHLIHLGTMGVYGYAGGDAVPEGYAQATIGGSYDATSGTTHGGHRQEIVYPPNPGSVYHMTKVMDHQMFQFYSKNYGLKITDLHQGIVWGTNTPDTAATPELINRFDYDGEYGTVLNRFLMQAAIGHPLTVYGTGGQTRAFIHITDTVRCISAAVRAGGPTDGKVAVYNQASETLRIRDLANLIGDITGATVEYVDNPRKEAAENRLSMHSSIAALMGATPIRLSDNLGLMTEVFEVTKRYEHLVKYDTIASNARW